MYSVVKVKGRIVQVTEVDLVTKKQFIGLKVKEARKAKNWSQADLIRASEDFNISASYLSEIESGKTKGDLSLVYLRVLAALLGKRVDFFIPKEV